MIKHLTAYPITETNIQTLCNITGFSKRDLKPALGWCVTYNEVKYHRWDIVPREFVPPIFDVDTTSYP